MRDGTPEGGWTAETFDALLAQMIEAEKILSFQDGAGNLKNTGKKVLSDIQALLAAKR